MNLKSTVSFLCGILFASSVFSSEIVTTTDGRKVKLNKNGTYSYISEKTSNDFKKIDFTDLLIDSEELLGKKVRFRGNALFSNYKGEKYPGGSIYQEHLTIGPSISIETSKVDRESLKAVHKCPVSCYIEISGVVKTFTNKNLYIDASSIRIVSRF